MQLKIKNVNIEIEEIASIVYAICIFSRIVRKFFSNYLVCILFTIFHELSHLMVASMYGYFPNKIKFKLGGVMLEYNNINKIYKKWIVIYFAGPFSNFILALIFRNIKLVYEINIALCIVNLIPLKPLDGYNILNSMLCFLRVKDKKRKIILNITQIIVIIPLLILSIYILLKNNNLSLLIILIYVVFINLSKEQTTKPYIVRQYKNM